MGDVFITLEVETNGRPQTRLCAERLVDPRAIIRTATGDDPLGVDIVGDVADRQDADGRGQLKNSPQATL
jgi:hypothetical protein